MAQGAWAVLSLRWEGAIWCQRGGRRGRGLGGRCGTDGEVGVGVVTCEDGRLDRTS